MEEQPEVVGFLKRIITYDKLFGSATLTCIVGIIWWASATDTTVKGNTNDMMIVKREQAENNRKTSESTAAPIINTAQIKVLQDDMKVAKEDIGAIKIQLQKKDSGAIKMYTMINYIYDKLKK